MSAKAKAAPTLAIPLGAHVTVPPLPGIAGLPGVWTVEQEQWCGGTRYLLLARKGAPGWHAVDAARCVLVVEKSERKASA